MSDLWSVLGYRDVAATCLELLGGDSAPVLVNGPPGVGKTWLAAGVGVMWERAGGAVVLAQGDVFSGDVPYYAFGFAMSGLSATWKAAFSNIGTLTRAGETLLGTGGLVTLSVEALVRARRARRSAPRHALSAAEQRVLNDLEQLSRKRPLLVIADNVHWWDVPSLKLLARLQGPEMAAQYPFLADLRVLAVRTTESYQRALHADTLRAVLPVDPSRSVVLTPVPRSGFADVLESLGSGPVSAETAMTVHTLSGGHLTLAGQCARRLAAGEESVLLATADAEAFLRSLIAARMSALGDRGRQGLEILQIAAVLGLTFRRDELVCAAGGDDAAVSRLIRTFRDETLLDLDAGVGRFAHDLYRQYFLGAGPLDAAGIHDRLIDCLRLLRPADYELRCLNATKADRPDLATTYAVQAALARQRDGLDWRDVSDSVSRALADSASLVGTFDAALSLLNEYRYAECLETLTELPRRLPRNLIAEAEYLKATCLLVTRSDRDRMEGRATLEAWLGLEDEEPELGCRIIQLLLFGYSMVRDKQDAIHLEGRLKRLLATRASFDPSAEDAMYTLERCAGRFHTSDRAVIATADAVAHFAPRPGQATVRRPVEYYRALVNLGANLLANARYDEALDAHRRLEELVAEYAPGTFPRLDYPRMTALQAEFRLGRLDAAEAVRGQRAIVEAHEVAGDPFYAENALAVYLALAGRSGDALNVYARLWDQLARLADPEPSQLYLIGANRCAVRYVSSATDVTAEWEALAETLRRVPYPFTEYLIRRHEQLGEVIREGEARTAPEFDACLISGKRPELGPFWSQLFRGFRLPDVEWWR